MTNDIRLRAGWVVAAVAGTIVEGDASREFGGVSIDTRTLKPGELFIAIRGERFDGVEFVDAAIAAGAAGIVISRGGQRFDARPELVEGRALRAEQAVRSEQAVRAEQARPLQPVAVIAVDDTTVALQALARAIRRESGTKVVAITGSAGKTTTKEVTSEFLAARYRVIRNRGTLNNHIGVPLSLIDLRHRPEIAVVEFGMNHAGEISTLVGVAEPDVRVWTNVGEAHLGFFASVDAIADAKAEIFEGASRSTVLVANADDERIAARLGKSAGRVVTFGIERNADVRAARVVDRGVDGMLARISTRTGTADIATPLVGRVNLANVLAAAAIALEFDVPLATIAERAATLRPAPHRGEIVKLSGGVTVIDDSYNANPTATKRALEVLAHAAAARRIAVLGEMLELGDRAVALHEEVGRAAAGARVDWLLAVGGTAAAALAEAAAAAGLPRANVRHYATSDEAAGAAVELLRSGDLVLVKGSRDVRTDRVVERLKAERG